jgi:hypothetical protein
VFCCPVEEPELVAFVGKVNKSSVIFRGSRCVKGDFYFLPPHKDWLRSCELPHLCVAYCVYADYMCVCSCVAWLGRWGGAEPRQSS